MSVEAKVDAFLDSLSAAERVEAIAILRARCLRAELRSLKATALPAIEPAPRICAGILGPFKVVEDDTLPPDVAEFRDTNNRVLGSIVNIGKGEA